MKHLKHITFLLVAVCLNFGLQAQLLFEKSYGLDEGLANVSVTDIKQDWKGQLWFANYGSGLSMFDGVEFTQYDQNDGLTSAMVRCLTFDEHERLWVGTVGGGISIFDNHRFIDFKDSIGGIDQNVYSLFTDQDYNIWIGTKSGLFRFAHGKLEGISETYALPDAPVQTIVQDLEGNIWLGFWEKGLYCLQAQKSTPGSYKLRGYLEADGLIDNNISSLKIDQSGQLMVGTLKGLQRIKIENGEIQLIISQNDGLPKSQVFDIVNTTQFGLCVAMGDSGVYNFDKNELVWNKVNLRKQGLCYKLFNDREDFIWLSLWQKELVRISSSYVQAHYFIEATSEAQSRDLLACSNTIIAAYPHKLIGFDQNIHQLITEQKIFERPIQSLVCLEENHILVNNGSEMHEYDNGEWKEFKAYKEFINRPVTDIATDGQGNLWMALYQGPPMKYDGVSFSLIRSENLDEQSTFDLIHAAPTGDIWLSSRKIGLVKIVQGDVSIFPIENLPKGKILDLKGDQNGNVWLACQGAGLVKLSPDGKTFVFDEAYGLPKDIRSVLIDRNQNIWIGSKTGVFVIRAGNNEENTALTFAQRISVNNGLPDDQCLPRQIVEAKNGSIWVATKRGIAEIDPTFVLIGNDYVFPSIHLDGIMMFFQEIDWRQLGFSNDPRTGLPDDLVLKPEQNQLSFKVKTVSVKNGTETYYRYRLEGLESEFSPISSGPLITYHDLQPGVYTLIVKACDIQGLCANEETRFTFRILKPFYTTWWFYALCFIALNTVFYLIVRIRDKQLLRNQQILEQKVTQRTLEIQTQKRIIEDNNRDITDSIKYAKRIQRAMIPSETELRRVFNESFTMYLPKNMVSGDFFMANQSHGKKLLMVADCTGHGVPGALMSMLGYGLFVEAIKDQNITTANQIFDFVSKNIILQLKQRDKLGGSRDGMDASLFTYAPETEEFEFVGAHNSGYLVGDVSFEDTSRVILHKVGDHVIYELKPDKQPIGINKEGGTNPFSRIVGKAKPGTIVYLMTDGYADQFGSDLNSENNGTGKKFRIKRLRDKLIEVHDQPLNIQHTELHTTLSIWKGALEQVDDITLIGVKL